MIKNPSQAVICLHDIARYVEHQFGNEVLGKDIRAVADRLNDVVKLKEKYGNDEKVDL